MQIPAAYKNIPQHKTLATFCETANRVQTCVRCIYKKKRKRFKFSKLSTVLLFTQSTYICSVGIRLVPEHHQPTLRDDVAPVYLHQFVSLVSNYNCRLWSSIGRWKMSLAICIRAVAGLRVLFWIGRCDPRDRLLRRNYFGEGRNLFGCVSVSKN